MRAIVHLLPVGAYLYGSVPYGFLMAKLIKGVDIREVGSGNIGATNAARVLGFKFFPVVFLLDFSKGLLPALAATLLAGKGPYDPPPLAVVAGAAAILGHVFPVFLGFKGGKAVAAGTGALLVLAPRAVLVAFVVWALVFAVWRYVSLASISGALALAASVWLLSQAPLGSEVYRTAFGTLGAALVIALHRSNIKRLLSGTERKIGSRARAENGPSAPRDEPPDRGVSG